jgi:hypothetical protein
MLSKLKLLIAGTLGLLLISVMVPAPKVSAGLFDNVKSDACKGVNLNANAPDCTTGSGGKLTGVLNTGLRLFSVVVGVIAVIMVIIAGVKYITSQGESAAVASAKNTLLYAIIGLVIVALAQIIVRFVLRKVQ